MPQNSLGWVGSWPMAGSGVDEGTPSRSLRDGLFNTQARPSEESVTQSSPPPLPRAAELSRCFTATRSLERAETVSSFERVEAAKHKRYAARVDKKVGHETDGGLFAPNSHAPFQKLAVEDCTAS